VAPWYGLGLSERRFGSFSSQPEARRLPTLVQGREAEASKNNKHADIYPLSNSPDDIAFDYTADGVRQSIEGSLQRLGVDSLDMAFVHDISLDFESFSERLEEQYENARKGAFRLYRRCVTKASSGLGIGVKLRYGDDRWNPAYPESRPNTAGFEQSFACRRTAFNIGSSDWGSAIT